MNSFVGSSTQMCLSQGQVSTVLSPVLRLPVEFPDLAVSVSRTTTAEVTET